MTPISRKEALEKGLATYYTGKPCVRGNLAERRANNWQCLCEDCKNYAAEKLRQYALENKEAVKERATRNREKGRERVNKVARAYYARNKPAFNKRSKRYHEANKETIRQAKKRYEEENYGWLRERQALARAVRKNRLASWYGEFDSFVTTEAYLLAKDRVQATGLSWDVDHLAPYQGADVSGLHTAHNLQVIPEFLNQRKYNFTFISNPDDWLNYV